MTHRSRLAFAGATTGLLLLVLTWVVAIHTGFGRHADQTVFRGFQDLSRPRVDSLAAFMARLCDPLPWVLFAVVPVVVAVVRRRPRVAIAVAGILVGANLTTHLLKPLLAAPRAHNLLLMTPSVSPASWPSGHATAAMSLALACVLAAPGRWRGAVAALGAAFAVAVSYSFLTLGWHYPSDVLGGFLVAGTWSLAAVGVLLALEARRPRRPPGPARASAGQLLRPVALVGLGAVLVGGVVALSRPHEVSSYVRSHEVFTLGAAGIGVLGLLVASVVVVVSRAQR